MSRSTGSRLRAAPVTASLVAGVATVGAVAASPLAVAAGDTTAPVLTSVSVVNPTVDVTPATGLVGVSMHLTDDSSGVDRVDVTAHCTGGCAAGTAPLRSSQPSFVAGMPRSQDRTVSLAVPQATANGSTWSVDAVTVTDAAGNTATYADAAGQAFPSGASRSFTVTRSSDGAAPTIGAVTFAAAANTLDVTTTDQLLDLSVTAADTFPGVDVDSLAVVLTPSNPALPPRTVSGFDVAKGTRHSGTFSAEAEQPFGITDAGTWAVTEVDAKDLFGNAVQATAPATGSWPTLTVHAGADTSPPQLQPGAALSADNAHTGDDVVLTTHITDDVTGFDHGSGTLSDGTGHSIPVTISTDDETATDTYVSTVHVPTTAAAGNYTLTALQLVDRAGHTAAASPPAMTLSVTSSASDTGAPSLTGVQVTSPTLQLTDRSSNRVDPAYLTVTDPAGDSGFDHGTLAVTGPDGTPTTFGFGPAERVSGDVHSGVYRVLLTPQHSSGDAVLGSYHLTGARLWSVGDRDASSPTVAVPADATYVVTLGGDVDETAPTLTSVDVAPGQVDTSTADRDVTFTFHVHDWGNSDSTAGVAYVGVQLEGGGSPSPLPIIGDALTDGADGARLISGNDTDGTYIATISLPKGTRGVTWQMTSAYVVDYAGNETMYVANPDPSAGEVDISRVGGTSHQLVDTATSSDWTAPTVKAFTVDDTSPIDASSGDPYTVSGTVELADSESGVVGGDIALHGPGGVPAWGTIDVPSDATPASDVTAPWHATLPPHARSGSWSVTVFTADRAGNYAQGAGVAPAPLQVTGVGDSTPPALGSLDVPTSADVHNGPADLVATVHASDAGSGIDGATLVIGRTSDTSADFTVGALPVGGNGNDVWLQADLPFSTDDAGTWVVRSVTLTDVAGSATPPISATSHTINVAGFIAGQPGNVTGLQATPQAHGAQLTWNPPDDAATNPNPLLGYLVDVTGGGQPDRHLTRPSNNATLEQLTPGQTYTISVRAFNKVASSDLPGTTTMVPLPDPVPNLTVTTSFKPIGSFNYGAVSYVLGYPSYAPDVTLACSLDRAPVDCSTFNTSHVFPDGPHTATVTATNRDGVSSSQGVQWVIDRTPPTTVMLKPAPVSLSKTFTVAWTGTDAYGIARYDLRRLSAPYNGVYSSGVTWLWNTTVTSGAVTGSPGRTYCFYMEAFDKAGNGTFWTHMKCTTIPLDERSLAASSGWKKLAGSGFFLGTALQATSVGRSLTRTGALPGRAQLLVDKGRGYGSVAVYYNGKLVKKLSLGATRTLTKQLLALPAISRRTTIVIKTVSSHPVRIDGLVLTPARDCGNSGWC